MDYPKVSILVPIYGTELYIEKCAKSLFRQNYDNIEYVFVNDCTKDNSMELLQQIIYKFPERKSQIKIINHEQNIGLGGTRLTGLNNATGDYVWFVDSDDFVEECTLGELLPYMRQQFDLITFSYYVEDGESISEFIVPDTSIINVLSERVTNSIWKNIIKRSIMYENGILPIAGINFAEDLHLLYRLVYAAKKRVTISGHLYYHYNTYNLGSMMHNISRKCVENLSDASIIVADFYDKNGGLQKYGAFIAYMLYKSYFLLKTVDEIKNKEIELKSMIKKADFLEYMFLTLPIADDCKSKILHYYVRLAYKFAVFKSLFFKCFN